MQVTVIVMNRREVVSGDFQRMLDIKKALIEQAGLSIDPSSMRLLYKSKIRNDIQPVTSDMNEGTFMVMIPPQSKACPCFPIVPPSPKGEAGAIKLTTLGFFQSSTHSIKVTQGRMSFTLHADDSTLGVSVRKVLGAYFKTDPSNIRLLAKGGVVADNQPMTSINEVMMLFSPGYHSQITGDQWLDQCLAEITSIQEDLSAMERAVTHRAIASNLQIQFSLNGIIERIDISLKGVDRVKSTNAGAAVAADLKTKLEALQRRAQAVDLTPVR